MTTIKDGGPAFPQQTDITLAFDGMTLRDYFAAKAMEGYVSDKAWRMNEGVDATARAAYLMADAMLKEREKNG